MVAEDALFLQIEPKTTIFKRARNVQIASAFSRIFTNTIVAPSV
jgi:hypothetical protein